MLGTRLGPAILGLVASVPVVDDAPLELAGEFPSATKEQWEALVRRGVDRLRTTTLDDITLDALATADSAPAPPGRPGRLPFVRSRTPVGAAPKSWDIRCRVDAGAAGRAVAELERGATSILLDLRSMSAIDAASIESALSGVMVELAPVVLEAGPNWPGAAPTLVARWSEPGIDRTAVRGSLGADPFGAWASDRSIDLDDHVIALADAVDAVADIPSVQVATIDGSRFHDAGASDAWELALTISAALATVESMPDHLGVRDAFGRVELRLAATVDQFATIAKFRAARQVWGRIAELSGDASAAGRSPIHAVTSCAMTTRYDPMVNALRATVACFAAAVAGADAITVRPFDELVVPGGSDLGRRLARNTQSVLAAESGLARVVDPAAGSWFVEQFTHELAAAAWSRLQTIDAAGGFREAVESGLVDEHLAAVRARRRADIGHRRQPLTGTSEYPNRAETVPVVDDTSPAPPSESGLTAERWAEPFERLRRRVELAAASTGDQPGVFLARIGSPSEFTARAAFAAHLFAVGGLAVEFGPATHDAGVIADAFTSSGWQVACVCSDDATYETDGVDVVAALHDAGAHRIYLAGAPTDSFDALTTAGITDTIVAGGDAHGTLSELLDTLGVP
ncbi:methylmalonyl-CoA mutase family protein [soil metagenome]